jgi:hypothetical protein
MALRAYGRPPALSSAQILALTFAGRFIITASSLIAPGGD